MKKLTAFFAVMAVLFSVGGDFALSACADSDIQNQIKASSPADELWVFDIYESWLDAVDQSNKVQRPKKSSYEKTIEPYYIDAPKGHSVYVYVKPESASKQQPVVYHGSRVLVWAVENDFAFITYQTERFEMSMGWVNADHISSKPTSIQISFGSDKNYRSENLLSSPPPIQKWSKFNFVDSKTKYVEIHESETDVTDSFVAMDIYYKVISRNGVSDASGERNVYINDGSGWEYVGSFEVNKDLEAVCIRVNHDSPRAIRAYAIIPTDAGQEKCLVSQNVQYRYYPRQN